MKNGKIAIEIDLKKTAMAALMAVSIIIACKTGMGDALVVIIPAGLAYIASKEEQ